MYPPCVLMHTVSTEGFTSADCAHFVLNSTSLQLTQAYSSQTRFFRSSWLDLA